MAVYFQKREIVVPGQLLAEGRYRPSIGTYDEGGKIFASLVGLAELRGNTIKVVPLEGVYIPHEGDFVIGTITVVAGNNWKVDIGGPYIASLHVNNALRRPYDEDISRYFDIGEVIAAEVIAFDRSGGPFLTIKGRGLRKLTDGMILEVSPSKIPRIIGRRGSMINMIKDRLRIQTFVGQNGRIWIKAPGSSIMRIAVKAFKMIESEAHTSKLTDRVAAMIDEELAAIGEILPEDEAEAETPEDETEAASEEVAPIDEVTTTEDVEKEETPTGDETTSSVEDEIREKENDTEEVKEE
ncbi:MAG: KH domain-containing protein [Candidatus Thorarchaeota archaeon]|nr:MAG: KH domain-containing protein [Candidatus Thorarchaeota archaeon]